MSDLTETEQQQIGEIVTGIYQRTERNRIALSMLLNEKCNKNGHLLAIRASVDSSPSYITAVPMKWVAENIRFAGDLPLFRGRADAESKRISIDEGFIDEIQQWQPDWTRQLPMAAYLATREHHKCPPLLIAGYQGWVYDPKAEQWGIDNKAMQDSINVEPLLESGEYYDLDTNDTLFYALGGQHRLMAIMGLRDLLVNGQLIALNRDGMPDKRVITRDEIVDIIERQTGEDKGSIYERLDWLLNERIGIEIVPAIRNGEGWKEALSRLREIFADANERARHLTPSVAGVPSNNL